MSIRRCLPILGALVVLALALATGTTSAPGASAGASGSANWTDPTGDSKGAPDLTGIAISDSGGLITLTVTAPGFSTSTAALTLLHVYLNTDMNPMTGGIEQDGCDYILAAGEDPSGWGWWVSRWDSASSKYVDAVQSPTMSFSRSGDSLTWTISAADLGNTTGFSFFTWSSTWDANDKMIGEDVAPDAGAWVYKLSPSAPAPTPTTTTTTKPAPAAPKPTPAAIKPVIGSPVTIPVVAKAGQRFTVAFPVTRSDNGAPLTKGTMICDPSVKGKLIPHAEQFKAGTARLSFVIPASAKGAQVRVHLTIVSGTQAATKVITFHVR